MYLKPKKKILKFIKNLKGTIIWEPVFLIRYNTGKKDIAVITDAFIPSKLNDPLSSVLLSRSIKLFNLKDITYKKPLDAPQLEHQLKPHDVLENYKSSLDLIEGLQDKKRESLEELRETLELNAAWGRYRALFVQSEILAKRKQSVFPYLKGEKIGGREFLEIVYLESVIKDGLGISKEGELTLLDYKELYYPLFVSEDFDVFELAWRKDKSLAYTNYFRFKELEKILLKLL